MVLLYNYNIQRVLNHLILNTSFLENKGLYYGKMGIVLFFFHYARYYKMQLYNDFAEDLLEEIMNEVNENLSLEFKNGLSGIGWGIVYLLNNGFVCGDPNDVLEEVDSIIVKYIHQNGVNIVEDECFCGILYYLNMRLTSYSCTLRSIYLSNWGLTFEDIEGKSFDLLLMIQNNLFNIDSDISKWKMGLKDGCSGLIMKSFCANI